MMSTMMVATMMMMMMMMMMTSDERRLATTSHDKRRRRDAVLSEEAKAKTAVIDSNVNFIFEPVEMEFYGSIKQMWESLQSRTLKIMKDTGQHTSRIVAKKHCHTPSV